VDRLLGLRLQDPSSSCLLQIREPHALPRLSPRPCTDQDGTLHRCGDRATDQSVQPVVIQAVGPKFPFIYRAAAAFGFDAVFAGQMFGQQAVLVGLAAIERKAAGVAPTGKLRVGGSPPFCTVLHHLDAECSLEHE
jgi:hypothetical protein